MRAGKKTERLSNKCKRFPLTSAKRFLSFAPSELSSLLIDLDHLLADAIRANSRRGEGVVGVRRKQPFPGFVLVLLLRQVLDGAENYGLVQAGMRMVVRKECG